MSDKMREEFEKWAVSEGMPITRGHYYDVYASAETRAAYLAWQAALTVPEGFVVVPVDANDSIVQKLSYYTIYPYKLWEELMEIAAAPGGKK